MWYIAHHGILGQRHGVRNGPPYPLGSGDHSASEKKAGWRKSLKKTQKSNYKILKKNKNSIGNNDITEMVSKNVSAEGAASLKKAAKNKAYDDYVKKQRAVVDDFLGKYGDKRVSMFSKEKYKDMVLERINWHEIMNKNTSPKVDKNSSMINEAKANKQIIAKQVAKELTNDLIRWSKDGSDTYMKGKDANAVQKQIEKQIAKNINDASNPFEFKDTFNFGIGGIKNYSDYAPLTIEYNPKTKKVTRIDYT